MFQVILLILVDIGNLSLGLLVFANNPRSRVNQALAFFTFSVAAWNVASFLPDTAVDRALLPFISKSDFGLSILMVFFFYVFCVGFSGSKLRKLRWVFLALALANLALIIVGQTFVVRFEGARVIYDPASFYYFFIVYLLAGLGIGFVSLINGYRRARAYQREQLRMLLYGLGLFIAIVLITNLVLPFTPYISPTISRLGIYSTSIFVVASSYAIIKHRLFDIRALVARSIAYILSIGTIAGMYGYIAYGVIGEYLTHQVVKSEFGQRSILTILAVILAFTFPAIRRFFEKITDRIFYRDRYDPQILVSNIGRVLSTEIELDPLSKKVIKILEDQMRLTDANIVVLSEENQEQAEDVEKEQKKDEIYYQTHTTKTHQIYRAKDLTTIRLPFVITDELALSDEKDMLEHHHIRAALTLKTKESFVGYLLLGDKRSGDVYNDQDVQTLRIIADELAVAIQNARSYTEIQAFNVTLKEKIKQATIDLMHANHDLKALDKAKDEFISMASHQLRTPLTAVRGYTSMVMEGDFGKVSTVQKDTLKQSFDAATRMTRLVDDLLNVSRIQSGKFRIERTAVDLNKVLPEEVSLISTTAGMKSVTVTYHAPKAPVPSITVDEGKTRQCLMNLMDNAIYYSSSAAAGGKVDIYLESDKTDVIFRVVDNGIGVPKDQQAKLFKKFYRAPNAQKARPDGTGLGLFLVGRVVKDQAGEIIFESQEGKGSTFGFKLPIKPAGEGLDTVASEPTAAPKTSPAPEAEAKKAPASAKA